jgi:hypothetical protein
LEKFDGRLGEERGAKEGAEVGYVVEEEDGSGGGRPEGGSEIV